MKKTIFLFLISLAACLFFFACEISGVDKQTKRALVKSPSTEVEKPKSVDVEKSKSSVPDPLVETLGTISAADLQAKYNFNIPRGQEKADALPPQPGQVVLGHTVQGSDQSDTNWTAFTLILYRDTTGFKVLTQKRAIKPKGVLETPGGHLMGGQTWREGAQAEIIQESGIKPELKDLVFLQGAEPQISGRGRLYGNANFFVVFNHRPKNMSISGEIDSNYGHRWIDLKEIYRQVADEQTRLENLKQGKNDGVFYSFFRGHLLTFCRHVVLCADL